MMSLCDVMRISHAIKGENYKKESTTEPQGCHSCHLGVLILNIWSISKSQTLYLGCLGASLGTSITRMDSVTCLSICMYPDCSGELLVGVT